MTYFATGDLVYHLINSLQWRRGLITIFQLLKNLLYGMKTASAGPRWRKYVLQFENTMHAFEVKVDKRKQALLLHYADDEVFNIYCTFLGEKTELNYKRLCHFFDKCFNRRTPNLKFINLKYVFNMRMR